MSFLVDKARRRRARAQTLSSTPHTSRDIATWARAKLEPCLRKEQAAIAAARVPMRNKDAPV